MLDAKEVGVMDKLDIILWVLGGGFTLMLLMWHSLNSKIEKVDESLCKRIDKLEDELGFIRKEVVSLDKEVAIITATLRFNGFDLDRHLASGE